MTNDEYRIFWNKIVVFIDEFRRNSKTKIKYPYFGSQIANAYYAGLVEFLSNEQGIQPPSWVYKKIFYLKNPFFPSGFKSYEYRLLTMIETPIEFKIRNIFLGENTFNRC